VIVEKAVRVEAGASVARMEARMWRESPEVFLEAVRRLEKDALLPEITRLGGRFFTYPTRADLRRAACSGLRVR
ncbi:MAG: hypothetical protein JOZ29_09095, partial [Deltaproteobacteria bacterium]|nr:hypothetical protein [Deltaproteobacteria bacterium]